MTDIVPRDHTAELARRADAVNQQLTAWFQEIPHAGQDGAIGILEQIINITDIDQLDRPWATGGLGEWTGYALDITNPRKMESDFPDGNGWFMLLDATVVATGEFLTVSTSSANCMAQALVANHLGKLPLRVIPRVADKPSSNGYYPQHFQVWREGTAITPEAVRPAGQPAGHRGGRPIAETTARIRAERLAAVKPETAPAAGASEEPGF